MSHPLIGRLEGPPTQPCFVCGLFSNGHRIDEHGQRVDGRESSPSSSPTGNSDPATGVAL